MYSQEAYKKETYEESMFKLNDVNQPQEDTWVLYHPNKKSFGTLTR